MKSKFVSVSRDMRKRFKDIELVYRILKKESKEGSYLAKVEYQVILKSSILLMLYNAVEGTMSSIMERFFDSIQDEDISLDKMNDTLKNLFYGYHLKTIKEIKDLRKFKKYDEFSIYSVSYKEMDKQHKFFSGNLDAKEIKKVLKLIGISTNDAFKESALKEIKDKRNALAHGEISFSEASQKYTNRELLGICVKTYFFLKKTIDLCEKALNRMERDVV